MAVCVRSTILTSQLPVARWHEQIGDLTLADGILDRFVYNAHRIEMRGDSMRKNRGKTNTKSPITTQVRFRLAFDSSFNLDRGAWELRCGAAASSFR